MDIIGDMVYQLRYLIKVSEDQKDFYNASITDKCAYFVKGQFKVIFTKLNEKVKALKAYIN